MSNEEFYRKVETLCQRMREVGMDTEAKRIEHMLHKVAWTSTSELFRALDAAFDNLLSGENAGKLPQQIRDEVSHCLRMLGST